MEDERSNRDTEPREEVRSQEVSSTPLPANKTLFDAAKLNLLFNASKALASTTNLDHLLDVIVAEVRNVIDCEGAGLVGSDPACRPDGDQRGFRHRGGGRYAVCGAAGGVAVTVGFPYRGRD